MNVEPVVGSREDVIIHGATLVLQLLPAVWMAPVQQLSPPPGKSRHPDPPHLPQAELQQTLPSKGSIIPLSQCGSD